MARQRFAFRVGWMACWAAVVMVSTATAQDGSIPTIRNDVQTGPPADAIRLPSTDSSDSSTSRRSYDSDSHWDSSDFAPMGFLVSAVITSPFWAPRALLGDDGWGCDGAFPFFPYDDASGYIQPLGSKVATKPWAVRFDTEYVATFNRLDTIFSSHLLLDTASRFGVDASFNYLEEELVIGERDRLQLGDCNFVYRFAQNEWVEFRTGCGFNWMSDSSESDFGFNFTYGFDLYPGKPWVLSTTFDWGTLGEAELFRFRTTAGVLFYGLEAYAGYEYCGIGRAHWNGLVAGVRVWF